MKPGDAFVALNYINLPGEDCMIPQRSDNPIYAWMSDATPADDYFWYDTPENRTVLSSFIQRNPLSQLIGLLLFPYNKVSQKYQ